MDKFFECTNDELMNVDGGIPPLFATAAVVIGVCVGSYELGKAVGKFIKNYIL